MGTPSPAIRYFDSDDSILLGPAGWSAQGEAAHSAPPCVSVLVFFPVPGFTESRDEMDALVAQIRTDPPERGFQSYDPPRQVGALEISSVDARTPGEVRVSDADTSFFQVSGWIYRDGNGAPATPGEGRESDTLEHLGGSWWKYSYRW